ncbi:aspartate/glutamate racemase family protein [Streptomyces sp. NPDC059165]|uniref:aspartate/glutamate racemase family protein n=1 Tax=Streptomyces sp. NPDC059165 TaxID=3346751 RepID=UPI00368019DB
MTVGEVGPAPILALLHTAPVHVPVFESLRDDNHPGLRLRHLVDEELLRRARAEGPDAVTDEVRAALAAAVAHGADAVLCTCSTVGAVAERHAAAVGVPVVRVDRPMARLAAAHRRIVVVAALASTLAPTVELIREEAGTSDPDIDTRLVDGAWELFASGDEDGFLDAVAQAVDGVRHARVIVLAQASMAGAAERVRTGVPVLTSPRTGLAAAAAAAGCPQVGQGETGVAVRGQPHRGNT